MQIWNKGTSRITRRIIVLGVFLVTSGMIKMGEAACDYYASQTGGGNGLSQGSPFQVSNFWSVASAGKTLCLLDGVYTGSSSMITPPNGLNGSSGNPITIKALNDGGVRINGQGASLPCTLRNNSYFVLEGVNCHNSPGTVVLVDSGTHDSIVRRVVAWDRADSNGGIMATSNSSNILFEDVAAFGRGRILFSLTQSANNATIRRAWGRFEDDTPGGPNNVYEWMYNSSNQRIENALGTWDAPSGAANPYGVIFMGDEGTGHQLLGSIFYVLSGAAFQASQVVYQNVGKVAIKDVVVYSQQSGKLPFGMGSGGGSNVLANVTEIGGSPSSIGSGWQISSRVDVDSVAQAPNVWNGAGTSGARVCKQYVNGTLTSSPLWPWPMNQRIIDAMNVSGRTPVNVTATVEQLFGTIPSGCREGGATGPTNPTNLRITSVIQ